MTPAELAAFDRDIEAVRELAVHAWAGRHLFLWFLISCVLLSWRIRRWFETIGS